MLLTAKGRMSRAFSWPVTVAAALAIIALAVTLPPAASAAMYTVGPKLNVPASLDTSDGLGYPGVDTAVPASPEAPNGEVHTSHFGADTAIWNAAIAGHTAAMPRAGQADQVKLEGCAAPAPSGPAPLNQIHFQTLAPQGGGIKVALTSGSYEIPVCGQRGASESTVTTYSPVNLCVNKGDYVGFNDEGGFVEPYYRSGVPYHVLAPLRGSESDSFLRGDGTNDGDFFDPSDRAAMEGFASRTGEELMLQVKLGTGPDARYVCPGGEKDAPPVLPALRVSRQTDGINRSRVVAVAIYCRPATGCKGSASLELPSSGGSAKVGRAGFTLPGNATSHLPIRVSPKILGLIHRNRGVTTRIVVKLGRRTFSQLVTIKIL
jgi:hypothetical protein